VVTRVVAGRARVVRELRAAAPLMAALRAPIPARGPWLTAVLNARSWTVLPLPAGTRPVAVVVDPHRQGRPEAAAFLSVRRRGPSAEVAVLGQGAAPLPGGRPTARLLAGDDAAADGLAEGIVTLLDGLRGGWTLRLEGLPLGDPTLRALAARLPAAVLANVRSSILVDDLDSGAAPVVRTRDGAALDRLLPELLAREPAAAARRFLRAVARLHAAIGQLELAVVTDGDRTAAALLTLVDGNDRWPWWGTSDVGGLHTQMGAPLVGLTARGGLRLPENPPFLAVRNPGRG
jgi:hypothetical protein